MFVRLGQRCASVVLASVILLAAIGCGSPTDSPAVDGSATDSPTVQSCESGNSQIGLPRLTAKTTSGAPSAMASYDGPAVVEGSTAEELILASSTTDPASVHLTISGLAPMPIVPLGASVWLTRTGDSGISSNFRTEMERWAFTVHDPETRRVLLGAVQVPHRLATVPLPTGAPVALDGVRPICSRATPDSCSGAAVTSLQVDVRGDTTTTPISNGTVAPVILGGVTYDVAVRGWYVTGQPTADFCSDTLLQSSLEVTVVAHDLDALVAALPLR
jgi:hypothetical protein